LSIAVARMEMVETRSPNLAGHIDDEIIGRRSVPRVPMVLPAGSDRIGLGVRRRE
jgi:hypothetical protein